MLNRIYLSVIIPAYNEEKTISNTLLDIDNYLSKQDFSSEIVVVNDGSKDKTAQVVNNLTKLIKNLKLIDNQENHGKGWVVKQGMLEVQGKYRLFMDADNATTVEHFDKIRPLLNKGYEIVIGSRDKKDAQGAKQAVAQTFIKRQLGNLGNLLIQLLAVPGIWDTQCGFKVFRADIAKNIFKRCKMDKWALDIEALALARKFGYKIGIIPVYWINNPESRVGLKGYFITLRELLRIKYNLIRGRYKDQL